MVCPVSTRKHLHTRLHKGKVPTLSTWSKHRPAAAHASRKQASPARPPVRSGKAEPFFFARASEAKRVLLPCTFASSRDPCPAAPTRISDCSTKKEKWATRASMQTQTTTPSPSPSPSSFTRFLHWSQWSTRAKTDLCSLTITIVRRTRARLRQIRSPQSTDGFRARAGSRAILKRRLQPSERKLVFYTRRGPCIVVVFVLRLERSLHDFRHWRLLRFWGLVILDTLSHGKVCDREFTKFV